MKLVEYKFGTDGGGVCCGPVEGSIGVELHIRTQEGEDYYVLADRWMEFCKVMIAKVPMFDVVMNPDEDGDVFEKKLDHLEKISTESEEFDECDVEEAIFSKEPYFKKQFLPAVQLAVLMLFECYYDEAYPLPSKEKFDGWIRSYMECDDLRKMKIAFPAEKFGLDNKQDGVFPTDNPQ